MSRIEKLRSKVRELYSSNNPNRADWADWLYENHVFVVANEAEKLAEKFGVKNDLAMAAGMLHDIADAVMSRFDKAHEEESKRIARNLLEECGYSAEETSVIVDDAITHHSCYGNDRPQTLEGKILATADALAHLQTNFYQFALEQYQKTKPAEEIKQWILPKIERDFRNKIFFDEVRAAAAPDYERLKQLFTDL